MMKRVHISVKGVVQGVYYRYNTLKEAEKFGLAGWVRNKADGSVEIICEGTEEDVNNLVQWCRQGPAGAYVREMDTSWEQYTGEFSAFEIR